MSGPAVATPSPDTVWSTLAKPLAARNSMRVWRGDDRGYDQVRKLATAKCPRIPAALPLYNRDGWAHAIALDFDAKRHGRTQVARDVTDAVALIHQAGGRVIVDRSPRGGQHVWVPLWAEHRVGTLLPLLRVMSRRWPSLDITPMINPATGCLTGPASPCIGGGHRELITPLDDAVDALAHRSQRGTVSALRHRLGLDPTPAATTALPEPAPIVTTLRSPIPMGQDALTFAVHGAIPASRQDWTRSEARMSVLVHAVRAGLTFDSVGRLIHTGRWAGMADAYAKYGSGKNTRLEREWAKATELVDTSGQKTQLSKHKEHITGGNGWQRRWLAQALVWVRHHPETAQRPQVSTRAILQALAYISRLVRARSVAPGGRWLSIASGLLAETTVWTTLRDLDTIDGSPLRLIRRHRGPHADRYELVTPTLHGQPVEVTAEEIASAHVTRISAVWNVIGHCAREIFEAIDTHPERDRRIRKSDIKRTSQVAASTVDNALARLREFGLITTGWGWVCRTERTLDDIAREHHVDDLVAQRLARHQSERRNWWMLLALWQAPPAPECPEPEQLPDDPMSADERACWLLTVLRTGPPPEEEDPFTYSEDILDHAVAMAEAVLGATPAAQAPTRVLIPA